MHSGRPIAASNPLLFGRRLAAADQVRAEGSLGDDARLFLGTFAAGFAFTMMLIA